MSSPITLTREPSEDPIERSKWFNAFREDPREHGTHYRYKLGCRCRECRKASTLHKELYRQRARMDFKSGLKEIKHGANGYGYYGCRCRICTNAFSLLSMVRMKEWRAKRKLVRAEASG